MILAAGLGLRMRPLTDTVPKPLIEVAGKPLIAYALDRLKAAGVEQVVVNVHWLPEQIESWAQAQGAPQIVISDERDRLLETGGGVAKALPLLGDDPFFVLNSDSTWIEGARPALERMREAWRPADMDGCCWSVRRRTPSAIAARATSTSTRRPARPPGPGRVAPFVFAGCYLAAPQLFAAAPEGPFSMNVCGTGRLPPAASTACATTACGCMSAPPKPSPRPSGPGQCLYRASRRGVPRALARAILAGGFPAPDIAAPEPLDLARWTILLPTRRAARSLIDAFLSRRRRQARLLPRIRALGDVEEDELLFADVDGGFDAMAPAISPLQRLFLLASLIRDWARRYPRATLQVARPLARPGAARWPAAWRASSIPSRPSRSSWKRSPG
jgi:N-acetyl-alpha-D-muramate 1-phosphate uridylyltransferase